MTDPLRVVEKIERLSNEDCDSAQEYALALHEAWPALRSVVLAAQAWSVMQLPEEDTAECAALRAALAALGKEG